MSDQYCFVCASNEGVFLDVTPDNQNTFGDQVETCLSTKIDECIDLSNKICYKCAYELDQCTKFVQKHKKSHEVPEPKDETQYCFLCYELVGSDRIFDITKDNNVIFNPLQKIRNIFNDDINTKNDSLKLICLPCRYNLDILHDLKRVFKETTTNLRALINEEISYFNFPKVHTDVVNRKTTITTFPDITFYGSIHSSDSDEKNMARSKRHVKGRKRRSNTRIKLKSNLFNVNKSKVRKCEQCYNLIANDIDMYRFYHTGLTVCKNCWTTIDPSNARRQSRQTQLNSSETKLCTVFLRDVLSEKSYRKKSIHQVEKDKDDNILYDSSQEEAKSSESSLSIPTKRNHIVNGTARRGRKRRVESRESKDDVERTPLKVTRLNKEHTNTNETKSTKISIDLTEPSTRIVTRQGCKRIIDERSSDSDVSLQQTETYRNKLNVSKTNRKKRKSILEETTQIAPLDCSDETSHEDDISHNEKSTTSSPTTSIKKYKEETRRRTRSSSMSSVETFSPTVEAKSPSQFKSPKSSAQSEVKTEYACDKCDKKFDSKLSHAKHRLTHLKQAALKLEKLTVSSVKKKQDTEVDSLEDDNVFKEVTSCSSRISTDKHSDDPSEDIAINVEDDTDDEEILTAPNTAKMEEEITKENEIIDKPNTTKSKTCLEEESANDENTETIPSEQCENSTVMPDETITLEVESKKDARNGNTTTDETNRDEDEINRDRDPTNKDKDETNKDKDETNRDKDEINSDKDETNKDKDETNRDNDESKDEDDQETIVEEYNVDEEKNKEIANDAEISSREKEKPISECNNDKGDPQEKTLCDSETIKSPILSIHDTANDNEDECCKNPLENNCENKNDIIGELEMAHYDLIDELSKNDRKELKKQVQEIPLSDKTKMLNDKTNLDEIMTINDDGIDDFDKLQNISKENMEIDIIADVINNAKDTIESNLSDGETYDEIRNDNDVAVISINSDSNDNTAKCDKIMEETTLINDSKEKNQLEEEIKELEHLVDSNSMNNEDEKVQDHSTYVLDNSSTDAANEILKEVFELAAAEVQQREDNSNIKSLDDVEMETLENISREIRKSADMPSLDPITIMEIDNDNDITLT